MFKGHPKGLFVAFIANMGERFGFYIMISIFVLFLQAKYGFNAGTASVICGAFMYCVCFFPQPRYSALRDRAFNIFYIGIDIGAMFAPTASEKVGNLILAKSRFVCCLLSAGFMFGIMNRLERAAQAQE